MPKKFIDPEREATDSEEDKREPWHALLKNYPQSERVNAVSIKAETLFTRLIAQADDYGNYYGEPRRILAYLYGHRWAQGEATEADVRHWRTELVTEVLAAIYKVDGREYLHIVKPHRRLRGDVQRDIRFPREPATLEEKALSDHGTRAGQPRGERGALEEKRIEKKRKEYLSSNQRAKEYLTKKGRILKGQRLAWFEEFWGVFDLKEGKSAAADSWYDIKGLDQALVDKILVGAKGEAARRSNLRKNGRTPKMAQGWLTERRWEDELPDERSPGEIHAAKILASRKEIESGE